MEKFENSDVEVVEEEKKTESKLYLLIVFLIFIAVTIGYATLSSTLLSHGIGHHNKQVWDVHFENISEKGNKVQLLEPASIDEDKTSIDFKINLLEIGSYYEFETDIKNDGNVDAKLTSLPIITGISTSQDAYTNYAVTYADGSNFHVGDIIEAGETTRVKMRIELDTNVMAEQLPKTQQTLYLSVNFDYSQN